MSSASRRIVRVQRQILKTIRADVRKALGPRTRDLRRYYEAYKREFRGQVRHSTKDELLKKCLVSDIILLGDYHTFPQSQKAALMLFKELVAAKKKVVLAVEMFRSEHQEWIDGYIDGKLTEQDFLEKINYSKTWGFSWENFGPLLNFAKTHRLQVLGLNLETEKLQARDAHAAKILATFAATNPDSKIFVQYGDLHLARGHIPKFLKAELKENALKRKILTIFQNSESIYWRLAEQKAVYQVDVVSLKGARYCLMTAPPWVKLQSYLEWAESSQLFDIEEGIGPNLNEIAHDRLKHLAEALKLRLPENLDFTIQTVNDLAFLNNASGLQHLNRQEMKIVKYHILGNRSIYIPGQNLFYLASPSANSVSEGVSLLAFAACSQTHTLFYKPREHFFAAVLTAMLAYFGSKVLNHNRKCDLEEDFKALLARPLPRKALPQEKLQRKTAKFVLKHCNAQRDYAKSKAYRAPVTQKGTAQISVFLESARCLGKMLGERLYASYVEGHFPAERVVSLFQTKLENPRQARSLYLELVLDLNKYRLSHSSKQDRF
ncbi:MAG: ChaN family lipoprotein [Bdellovibrionota bacterium]